MVVLGTKIISGTIRESVKQLKTSKNVCYDQCLRQLDRLDASKNMATNVEIKQKTHATAMMSLDEALKILNVDRGIKADDLKNVSRVSCTFASL